MRIEETNRKGDRKIDRDSEGQRNERHMTWTWQNGDRQIERDRMKKIIWETIIEQKTDWGWRDTHRVKETEISKGHIAKENQMLVTILQVKIDRVEDTDWWKEILRQTAEVGFFNFETFLIFSLASNYFLFFHKSQVKMKEK